MRTNTRVVFGLALFEYLFIEKRSVQPDQVFQDPHEEEGERKE